MSVLNTTCWMPGNGKHARNVEEKVKSLHAAMIFARVAVSVFMATVWGYVQRVKVEESFSRLHN